MRYAVECTDASVRWRERRAPGTLHHGQIVREDCMIARASRDDTPRNAIIRPPARVAGTEPATTLAGLTTREEGRTTGDRGDAARGARVRRTLVLLARG